MKKILLVVFLPILCYAQISTVQPRLWQRYGLGIRALSNYTYFLSGGAFRYHNGQLQFSNDLINWLAIPQSLPTGAGWTLGSNKIYQTTVGNRFYWRMTGGDTTASVDFYVGGTARFTRPVQFDSGLVLPNNGSLNKGGYIFDGVDDEISVLPDTNFRSNLLSVEAYFSLFYQPGDQIVGVLNGNGYHSGMRLMVKSIGQIYLQLGDGTNYMGDFILSNYTYQWGKRIHLVIVIDNINYTVTFYVDGIRYNTVSYPRAIGYNAVAPISIFLSDITHTGIPYGMLGQGILFRVYNKLLTDREVALLYNNGYPELAELPYELRGASQTVLTSGTLRFGKTYRIDNYVPEDDFTNVGASSNASGVIFVATGTTPSDWTKGSSLRQIGCVAEYRPENAGAMGWIETQNGLHGITSGNPVSIAANRDYRSGISTTTVQMVNSQKAFTILEKVIVKNNYAGTNTFFLGTSTSANELINGATINNGETKVFNVDSYSATIRSLFVRAGNSNVDVTFIYKPIDGGK